MKLTIKEIRAELSTVEFAELIGVSRQAVEAWESGKYRPRLEHYKAIENEFGLEYCPEYIRGDFVPYFKEPEEENN